MGLAEKRRPAYDYVTFVLYKATGRHLRCLHATRKNLKSFPFERVRRLKRLPRSRVASTSGRGEVSRASANRTPQQRLRTHKLPGFRTATSRPDPTT